MEEEGWISEKRWCLDASLLAWWTRWSQPSHRAASSAVQNTEASSLLHTSHWIFISLIELSNCEDEFRFGLKEASFSASFGEKEANKVIQRRINKGNKVNKQTLKQEH